MSEKPFSDENNAGRILNQVIEEREAPLRQQIAKLQAENAVLEGALENARWAWVYATHDSESMGPSSGEKQKQEWIDKARRALATEPSPSEQLPDPTEGPWSEPEAPELTPLEIKEASDEP